MNNLIKKRHPDNLEFIVPIFTPIFTIGFITFFLVAIPVILAFINNLLYSQQCNPVYLEFNNALDQLPSLNFYLMLLIFFYLQEPNYKELSSFSFLDFIIQIYGSALYLKPNKT